MKRLTALALVILLLAGCTGMELTDRAFVLGAALDLTPKGNILVTAQFYKPNAGKTDTSEGGTFVNIESEGKSILEAIRNITLHLGRKAQWSHTQTLLIGEDLARSDTFKKILDLFYRDGEPRLTIRLIVTKGKAGLYFSGKPYIERTISEQTRKIQEISTRYSGKTIDTDLLDLNVRMHSESATAVVPYLIFDKENKHNAYFSGGAVLSNGRMTGWISPDDMKSYLMLTNQFENGIIEVSCGPASKGEAIEVMKLRTKLTPRIDEGGITVDASVGIEGTVWELVCTELTVEEDMYRYQEKIAETIERQLAASVNAFHAKKSDLIGIGNEIYQRYPKQWKRLKHDWNDRLADIRFRIEVNVSITSSGLEEGASVFQP